VTVYPDNQSDKRYTVLVNCSEGQVEKK